MGQTLSRVVAQVVGGGSGSPAAKRSGHTNLTGPIDSKAASPPAKTAKRKRSTGLLSPVLTDTVGSAMNTKLG